MSFTDAIAAAALIASLLSVAISVRALRETRKANQIALVEHRAAIYDKLHELVLDALTKGIYISKENVAGFSSQLVQVEKYLPKILAAEIATFYQDCECVVWGRSLTPPVDEEYTAKINAAAVRIHRSGLELDKKLLALIQAATDA